MRSTQQPLPSISQGRGLARAALMTALVLSAPVMIEAQVFPPNEPRVIVDEDISTAAPPALPVGVTKYSWDNNNPAAGVAGSSAGTSAPSCGAGFWDTHLSQTGGLAGPVPPGNRPGVLSPYATSAVFVINESVVGDPGHIPSDWENFRFEFDFNADANAAVGIVWGGADDEPDLMVNHGYLFYFDDMPTQTEAVNDGDRARWHLVRRLAGYDLELASGEVELNMGNNDLLSIYNGACYRLRFEYFCGGLRILAARISCSATDCAVTQCSGGGITCTDWETCNLDWCPIIEWIDTDFNTGFPQPQNFVGPFAGGTDTVITGLSRIDNLLVRTWDYTCSDICDPWTNWTEDWNPITTGEGREELDLKFLYTGALRDYAYGTIWGGPTNIDITVSSSRTDPATTVSPSSCAGWTVLHGADPLVPIVDLPPPGSATDNLAEMLAYLEPMASSVKLVNDAGTLGFEDSFDNARELADGTANPNFDPNPLPTRGSTPINNSLLEAYDWYVNQRTVGEWSTDPLVDCRLWYVIFITDGEERCPSTNPDAACDPTGAAELFANPTTAGVDPALIYTVGFSESVPADSPLRCIADITGGRFFSATDAGQLVNVLYDVLDEMEETSRAYVPFAVSPPPAAGGAPASSGDTIAIYPFFVPRNQRTVWDGDLYAFALNLAQPTLPATADCTIDYSSGAWQLAGSPAGATEILENQLSTLTRNVFLGSDLTGSWARHAITDIFTNAGLRTEFKTMLNVSGGASDLEAVEVVNFVRNIYANPGSLSLSPAPVNPPRPSGYSALGDIYHSQPRILGPPNEFMLMYDYGLGPAPGYIDFVTKHQYRRRAIIVGANDAQIHAFDGGFYDRDTTNYDDLHDLGTGIELFSYVPEAVVNRLHRVTYGTEHLYTVDGQISEADVLIDIDADSTPEWRTVALATMRRGGRGVVALDVTTPDPVLAADDYKPALSTFPGCLDGTTTGCDTQYPHVLWEFHDVDVSGVPNDADNNCPVGFTGDQCAPYWDLGWTWSKPAIARIGVYYEDGSGNVIPTDTYVAFFGGGWDRTESDVTGRYFYGVDIETGATVVKELIGVAVPGSPTLLDSDNDGFHDKIFFGDSNGSIWRMSYPSPYLNTATGATAGTLRRIFDVSTTTLTVTNGRQQFFNAPALAPVLFDGVGFVYAVAIGAGDRANLGDETSGTVNHFFVVLDDLDNDTGTNPAYDETDLVHREYGDLINAFTPQPGSTVCTDSAFIAEKGWYLELRENEKVNYDAYIFANHVFFPTFQAGTDLIAANSPNTCTPAGSGGGGGTGGGGGGGTGGGGGGGGGSGPAPEVCRAAGIGRIYDVGLTCGLGEYSEFNGPVIGWTVINIGDETRLEWTRDDPEREDEIPVPIIPPRTIITSTTNWRQE